MKSPWATPNDSRKVTPTTYTEAERRVLAGGGQKGCPKGVRMTEATEISPVDAAEAVGLTVFEFDVYLRDQAAARLESLATDIRRGHEAARGDVFRDEYDGITEGVWRVLESAQVLTAHWTRELREEMGVTDS